MVAYTDTLGFYKGQAAFGAHADKRLAYVEVELDFADIIAARSAASATAFVAGDSLQVIQVPAGALMLAGGINVTSAESTNTTGTFDLGCTGGTPLATNALADDEPNSAVANHSIGLAAPVLFTSADTLDLILNTAVPTDCVIRAWALFFNTNSY